MIGCVTALPLGTVNTTHQLCSIVNRVHYSFRYVTWSYYLNKELCSIVNRVHYSFSLLSNAIEHKKCKNNEYILDVLSEINYLLFKFVWTEKRFVTSKQTTMVRKVISILRSNLSIHVELIALEIYFQIVYYRVGGYRKSDNLRRQMLAYVISLHTL